MPQKDEKKTRFLVVDDQFNVRRMVANFLRTFGYTRFSDAANGAEALEILTTKPIEFIICDWNMPTMNGLQFLREVRGNKKTRRLPFLMVTAEVSEEIVAEAIEEGVDDYITKPFQAGTLIQKIEAIQRRIHNPSPIEQAVIKGEDSILNGDYQQAVMMLEQVLEQAPDSPKVHLMLGRALEGAGSENEAMEHYNKSVVISKQFVKAHDRLAGLHTKRGEEEEAARHLKQAARISPRNPKRQLELGKTLLAMGDEDGAVKALQKARKNAGPDLKLAAEIGETLLSANANQEAALAFEGVLEVNPKVVHIYNRLGIAYRRQKLYGEAVEQYKKALKITPDDENLYYNMALVNAEAGNRAGCRDALAKALKIKPDFVEAQELLKRLAAAG